MVTWNSDVVVATNLKIALDQGKKLNAVKMSSKADNRKMFETQESVTKILIWKG